MAKVRSERAQRATAPAKSERSRQAGYGPGPLAALQRLADAVTAPRALQRAVWDEEEPVQGKALQRAELPEEEELQMRAIQRQPLEEEEPLQARALQREERQANRTGLPEGLRSGVEQLSGHAMDGVRVHYNSSQPAAVQAHAFAQGSDIHIGPGQERHLPHEAWHVVQQAQGRVPPTTEVAGLPVNDDAGLEREADVMGHKALSAGKAS